MTFPNPWGAPVIPGSHRQYVQYFPDFISSANRLIQVPTSYKHMARPMHRGRRNNFPTQLRNDRGSRRHANFVHPSRRKPKLNNGYGIGRNMEGVYMIVNNIPKEFRSMDLRSFFSQFIETSGFVCFHFIHRPEIQILTNSEQSPEKDQSEHTTSCCLIKVDTKRASEFIESYNGKHWVGKDGVIRMTRCFIKNIVIDHSGSHETSEPQKKKRIPYKIRVDCDTFSFEDLNRFGEMRPPSYMPNGNVGTKISQFQEENHACRLPPKVILKLGLEFPGTEQNSRHQEQELAEEWDNHNALHDDVAEQEGTKGIDCDKRAKNPQGMRVEEAVRNGTETKVDHVHEFAAFDKYSNGFGRKFMEALGWKEGQGIGKNCSGMSEPLMNDGKKPTDKKGLGFHDKKLNRKSHPKKIQKDSDKSEVSFSVSTNTNPEATGSQDSGFMYISNSKSKYQREFVKGQEDVNSK